ncbi:MAG: hypothetical protein KDC54_13735 [Lewinella sp.]|nr:hypothetical protein [Lewinella sp.]
MVLELSKSFTHSCGSKSGRQYAETELKSVLLQLMERNGITAEQIRQTEDGKLQIAEDSNLKVHSLLLQAEEMGLEMKLTRKTVIEIC